MGLVVALIRWALVAAVCSGCATGSAARADLALAELDRAVVEARAGAFVEAGEALAAADPRLEVLDLTRDPAADVASALFAPSAAVLRVQPWEKLMVNAVAVAVRLAAGDRRGAKVEARRLEVVERYLEDRGADVAALVPATQALRGVVAGVRDDELAVVLLSGGVPARVVDRSDPGRPVLALAAAPPAAAVSVQRNGEPLRAVTADVAAMARATFEAARPGMEAAAGARRTLRAGSAEGVRLAFRGRDWAALLAGATHDALVAADEPDTRAWATVPGRLTVVRGARADTVELDGHPVAVGATGVVVCFERPAGGWTCGPD